MNYHLKNDENAEDITSEKSLKDNLSFKQALDVSIKGSFNTTVSLIENKINSRRENRNWFLPFSQQKHEKQARNKGVFFAWNYLREYNRNELIRQIQLGEMDLEGLDEDIESLHKFIGYDEFINRRKSEFEQLISSRKLEISSHKLELEHYDEQDTLLSFAECKFNNWVNAVGSKPCYILGRVKTTKKIVAVRIYNRYMPEYAADTIRKFRRLRHKNTVMFNYSGEQIKINLADTVFLTLTFDSKKISLEDSWLKGQQHVHRFLTHLFEVLGERLDYVLVTEPQARNKGYCHFHILFFGAKRLLDNGTWEEYNSIRQRRKKTEKTTLENLWKMGFTWVNKTEENKEVKQPLSYMLKYFGDVQSDKGNKTASLLWLFNKRSYTCSRNINLYLNYVEQEILEFPTVEGNMIKKKDVLWLGVAFTNAAVSSSEELYNLVKLDIEKFYGGINGYG